MMPVSKRMVSMAGCLLPKRLAYGSAFFNKFIQNNYSGTECEMKKDKSVPKIHIKPQQVVHQPVDSDIGKDMVGDIPTKDVIRVVKLFLKRPELFNLIADVGLDENMFQIVKESFTKYCEETQNLPLSLYIVLSDLIKGEGHVMDLFPYFSKHIYHVYPHLQYIEELKIIGDLQNPALWYPLARSMKRKLIFHYGPTNSGKTYTALKRFMEAKNGIYCAPLKLLAVEIFQKANAKDVPCDLLTGDDRRTASNLGTAADHISCTVEMADTSKKYDVAVIDEIQMLQCPNRGFAWTRALLGLAATEIHLCGESSALDYLKEQAKRLKEDLECFEYKRLTKLYVEKNALKSLKNIEQGDCIVCFSKKEIFTICLKLHQLRIQFAVIYGTLPPNTKQTQSEYFNAPCSGCNVLVATDAIGLGVNLNIRRIIFFSLKKKGQLISVSNALQIAGRAGRYNSQFPEGFVTTFYEKDLAVLKELLSMSPEVLDKAGLFPLSEQIEIYSYYLPELRFNDLLDVFITLARLSDMYFMCDINNMRYLARQLAHLKMNVKYMYLFCCAPVNKGKISEILFIQFAKRFSLGLVTNARFMQTFLKWPPEKSKKLSDLENLEDGFDCLELYLWFGQRIPEIFTDKDLVQDMQAQMEAVISESVKDIISMVKAEIKLNILSAEASIGGHRFGSSIITNLANETETSKVSET